MSETPSRTPRKRASVPPGTSWSVFTLFRRTKLALGRGFPTWEGARDFALRLRRERFHDREAIHVIDDSTGERCALPSADDDATPPAPAVDSTIEAVPVAGARRSGFTVYASFHRGRIPLARRVETITEAMAVVDRFRRNRFDSSQRLVIVDETSGESLMADEVQGSSPALPSRERLIELNALVDKAMQHVSAHAARERSPGAEARLRAMEDVARALLACTNQVAGASRGRGRPSSGVRGRVSGVV